MRILGAILAGGRSRRFGSDKALAAWRGQTLVENVTAALRPHVSAVVVCGRDWPGEVSIADRPGPDLGPLGGLNAALAHGAEHGFDRVLSLPCDVPSITARLIGRLISIDRPAVVVRLPVIGIWPTAFAPQLDRHIAGAASLSVMGWVRATDAEELAVADPDLPRNINRPEDLAHLDA